MAGFGATESQGSVGFHSLGMAGVAGTVRYSGQAQREHPGVVAAVRTVSIEGRDPVVEVAVDMRQRVVEGRRWAVVRCIIPVSTWAVDRGCIRVGSNRILGEHW